MSGPEKQEKEFKNNIKTAKIIIEQENLFDPEYYRQQLQTDNYTNKQLLQHYLTAGYKQHLDPSENFNTDKYIRENKNTENPLIEYVLNKYPEKDMNQKIRKTAEQTDKIKNEIYTDILLQENIEFDKKAPMISIIILNHNGAGYLEDLIDSLVTTTDYPNYEVIIVDNNSSDNSLKIIEKFNEYNFKIISNQINKTYSEACNDAVDESTGDYIVFMDNDIKLIDGWLNNLVKTSLDHDNAGVISPRLIYPDCEDTDNTDKSYKLQNTTVKFRSENGFILPYSPDDGKEYRFNQHTTEITPAANGSLILIKKSLFKEIGGFDENYEYGYETVDLSLRLYRKGYNNYYNPESVAFHYNHSTINTQSTGLKNVQHKHNRKIFANKWNKYLKRKILEDKINKTPLFCEKPLKFMFITLEEGDDAAVGDYFIAKGLAKAIEDKGYQTIIKSKNDPEAADIDEDVDVLISLINSYDLDKVKFRNELTIKIAWILNWPEYWLYKPYFEEFDLILCSNSAAVDYIKNVSGYSPLLFPIATDPEIYNTENNQDTEIVYDYIFAGNDWHDEREIREILQPDSLDYKFALFSKGPVKFDKFEKYNKGYIPYDKIPELYSKSKIIIDDATDLTKTPSGVNARVFDAVASGRLVLTNGAVGADELFKGMLPVYNDSKTLQEQLDLYLNNPDLREKQMKKLKDIVLKNHTYPIRADRLISYLKDYMSKTKVIIKIPTPKEHYKFHWGDYHFGIELQHEFNMQKYPAKIQLSNDWNSTKDALYDIVLLLRGVSFYEPKDCHYNIEWNISHPNRVSIGEYDSFDKVYIASHYWSKKIKQISTTDVDVLLQCTNPEKFHREPDENYESELLFVGNSRMIYRKILKDLLPTDFDLKIYGNNWDEFIEPKYIKDNYIPNEELYKAYSSTKVLLNDHWKDMLDKGFISNRIFDGLACGCNIVTDHVKDIEKIFPDEVIVYDKKEELNNKIRQALDMGPVNSDIIEKHTYKRRVCKIIQDYEDRTNKKK